LAATASAGFARLAKAGTGAKTNALTASLVSF
jgi:hypothetical protein